MSNELQKTECRDALLNPINSHPVLKSEATFSALAIVLLMIIVISENEPTRANQVNSVLFQCGFVVSPEMSGISIYCPGILLAQYTLRSHLKYFVVN
ncbi:hypothetical protein PMAYCL1PPCAC_20784 [Pristionchus mayeri]|uniref:Uncharacterized protein n=1 Tax=Pristionchus mayeri TaxID=1317129 RepID=A0AAN5CUR2_9BILA|nr:hypothetical protein PMAYCL1PPCAC_20784 [Pristionchus mayeri]